MFGLTRIPIGVPTEKTLKEKLDLAITQIGLKVRTSNILESDNILEVRDLLDCTQEGLLSIPNFGNGTLKEVLKVIEELGFKPLE